MVREFRLIICADEPPFGHAAEDTTRALECIVEAETVDGGFNSLLCEPLIISELRSLRTRFDELQVGERGGQFDVNCAQ